MFVPKVASIIPEIAKDFVGVKKQCHFSSHEDNGLAIIFRYIIT